MGTSSGKPATGGTTGSPNCGVGFHESIFQVNEGTIHKRADGKGFEFHHDLSKEVGATTSISQLVNPPARDIGEARHSQRPKGALIVKAGSGNAAMSSSVLYVRRK